MFEYNCKVVETRGFSRWWRRRNAFSEMRQYKTDQKNFFSSSAEVPDQLLLLSNKREIKFQKIVRLGSGVEADRLTSLVMPTSLYIASKVIGSVSSSRSETKNIFTGINSENSSVLPGSNLKPERQREQIFISFLFRICLFVKKIFCPTMEILFSKFCFPCLTKKVINVHKRRKQR